ncbi:MAG: penicillin-binding protein [Spirochaetaceae bacterium]
MRDSRLRFTIVFVLLGAGLLLLVVQFGTIMLSSSPERQEAASRTFGERGAILDRNGNILAIQTERNTVTAWRPSISNPGEVGERLGPALSMEPRYVEELIRGSSGFVVIKRTVSEEESARVRELIDSGRIPGVRLEPDSARVYPEGRLASHVLGYVGRENVGLDGVEYMFNGELLPTNPLEQEAVGNQIVLTLDAAIQSILREISLDTLEEHQADSVTSILMDSRTGELLAYVSIPDYDPNEYNSFGPEERRNRPITMVYEPGSVFKIYSLGSLLHLGGLSMNDRFNTTGGYQRSNEEFLITDLNDYGIVDVEEIVKYSSNVGAAMAAETASAESFYRMLRLFGFGERTGVGLNGEERGLLAEPDAWSRRTQQTIAIGQEIGVTALQLVAAATVFANDGVLLRPQIVQRVVSPEGRTLRRFSREPVREVVSPEVARQMLNMMEAATGPDSTARRINVEGVSVAAKTGTAEVYDSTLGAYSEEHFIASTLAIYPSDEPQYILYVMIDHPRGGSFYGGRIAAPVVDRTIESLMPYVDIPRAGDQVVQHPGRVRVTVPRLPEMNGVIPNFEGLPKRALLPLLEREDMEVSFEGSGWVVDQQPPAGTRFEAGMRLKLILE